MSSQDLDESQHQQVHGIEGVAQILDGPVVGALLAPIQPDGNQSQQSKTLLGYPDFSS